MDGMVQLFSVLSSRGELDVTTGRDPGSGPIRCWMADLERKRNAVTSNVSLFFFLGQNQGLNALAALQAQQAAGFGGSGVNSGNRSPSLMQTNPLARWFSPDLLSQAAGSGQMPSLPALSSQKILSLEELERMHASPVSHWTRCSSPRFPERSRKCVREKERDWSFSLFFFSRFFLWLMRLLSVDPTQADGKKWKGTRDADHFSCDTMWVGVESGASFSSRLANSWLSGTVRLGLDDRPAATETVSSSLLFFPFSITFRVLFVCLFLYLFSPHLRCIFVLRYHLWFFLHCDAAKSSLSFLLISSFRLSIPFLLSAALSGRPLHFFHFAIPFLVWRKQWWFTRLRFLLNPSPPPPPSWSRAPSTHPLRIMII